MSYLGFLQNFHHIDTHNWSIYYQHNRYYLLNNYTADQFVYQEIQAYSKFMEDIYKNRDSYTMANTPQIILPTVRNNNIAKIQMLIQTAPFLLNKVIKKNMCQNTIKEFLKNVLKTVQILVKKYGFFIITKQMVRVTSSSNLLIWFNEEFLNLYRQFPLNNDPYEDCKLMVFNLLNIFQDVAERKLFQSLRKRVQSQKFLTFQKFRMMCQTNLKCCAVEKIKRRRVSEGIPDFIRRKTFTNITTNSRNNRCTTQKAQANNVNIIQKQPSTLHYNNSQSCLNKIKTQFQSQNLVRSLVLQNQDKKSNKKLHNFQSQQHLKSLQTTSYPSSIHSSGNLKPKIPIQIKKPQQNNKRLKGIQKKYTIDNLSPSIIEDANEQISSVYEQQKHFIDLEQQFKQILQQKNKKTVQPSTIFYQLQSQLESILNQCA